MNTYDLTGEYGVCHLSNGKDIIFDKEDYPILKEHTWRYEIRGNGCPMVRTRLKDKDGKVYTKFLTVLLGYRGRVSAKNGNILDVRKSNLEMRTETQIAYSTKRRVTNKTGVKGVTYNEKRGKFIAKITYRGECYNLGAYDTLMEATRARTIAGDRIFCHGYVNAEQKALAEIFKD